jgi:hypothetical protein
MEIHAAHGEDDPPNGDAGAEPCGEGSTHPKHGSEQKEIPEQGGDHAVRDDVALYGEPLADSRVMLPL